MFCVLVTLVIGVCLLGIAWGVRSMLVGGARPKWWLVWWLLLFWGMAGGCVWMVFHPVDTSRMGEEYRGALTLIGYGFWCLTFTFSLLLIYTVVVLFRFGLWPMPPGRVRGCPVLPPGKPVR